MKILLTNDDGIYAPGLAAMERSLRRLGEVFVVAPSREQSGVAHSITFLTPLMAREVYVEDQHWGWTVDGSPADCVKLGISNILPDRPDIIVSGMNGGLNAGINVLYSGTVAAAVEGAFYGITSFAVSVEYDEKVSFAHAADLASDVIEKILKQKPDGARLFSVNLPLAALTAKKPEALAVPMDVTQYWETFEQRTDPMGRSYYWLSGRPDPCQPKAMPVHMTDMQALNNGYITVTPLHYDMTFRQQLETMSSWNLNPDEPSASTNSPVHTGPKVRVSR
jgi:5'-nucleotidase